MKTIKVASSPTSKFLHFAKYPVLMLIAIFGILFGGTQSTAIPSSSIVAAEIGGQSTPRPPILLPPYPNSTVYNSEIGGTERPRPTLPFGSIADIGGQHIPKDNDPLGFHSGIGGQGSHNPRHPLDPLKANISKIDIGDNQQVPKSPNPLGVAGTDEIGGTHGEPRSGGVLGIGGQSLPRTGVPVAIIDRADIGGPQSAPRVPPYSENVTEVTDIGGNITPRTSTPVLIPPFMETEIGGNQGAPKNPLESFVIGGQNQNVPKDSNPLGLFLEESDMDSCLMLKYKRRL